MRETNGPTAVPRGWLRLDRAGWWGTFAANPVHALLVVIVPFNLGSALVRGLDVSAWWGLLLSLGTSLPVVLVLYLVQRLRYPQPWVNVDTGELRAGRQVAPLSDITWARLDLVDRPRSQTRILTLRFGAAHGPRASVRLRNRRGQAAPAAVTALVSHIVRHSSIAVPQSSADPTGRFARYNFPGFLSRADALEVVLNPPTILDPAPVALV